MNSIVLLVLLVLIVSLSFITNTNAIYADQAGLTDWQLQTIGANQVYDAKFYKNNIYILTKHLESNNVVLSSLKSKDLGEIEWRKIIQDENNENNKAIELHKKTLVMVNGNNVKLWKIDGSLIWNTFLDNSFDFNDNEEESTIFEDYIKTKNNFIVQAKAEENNNNEYFKLFKTDSNVIIVKNNQIYVLSGKSGKLITKFVPKNEIKSVSVNTKNEINIGFSDRVLVLKNSSLSVKKEKGLVFGNHVVEIKNNKLVIDDNKEFDLEEGDTLLNLPYNNIKDSRKLPRNQDNFFVYIKSNNEIKIYNENGKIISIKHNEHINIVEDYLIISKMVNNEISNTLFNISSKKSHTFKLPKIPKNLDKNVERLSKFNIENVFVQFFVHDENDIYVRIVFNFNDQSLGFIEYKSSSKDKKLINANWLWLREESLSAINSIDSVEIPNQHQQGDDEVTKVLEDGDVMKSIMLRLEHQFSSLETSFFSIFDRINSLTTNSIEVLYTSIEEISKGKKPSFISSDAQALSSYEKEEFGFNKMLILSCKNGKLFGLHSETKEILWVRAFPEDFKLIVSRPREYGSDHYPELLILFQKQYVYINALTGEGNKLQTIDEKIQQVLVLPPNKEFKSHLDSHRQIIIGKTVNNKATLIPNNKESIDTVKARLQSKQFYLYTINDNKINGFHLTSELNFVNTWTLNIPQSERILKVSGLDATDKISLPAKALGDLSLLIKHINPNLITIISESITNNNNKKRKEIHVILLDSVTGAIVKRYNHKDCVAPVSLTMFENWIVYSYFNVKKMQTEISTITMHEGAIDKWSLAPWKTYLYGSNKDKVDATSFSSFDLDIDEPIFVQKTFRSPLNINNLKNTKTRNGISSKNVIISFNNGQVSMMDNRLLDPRRPENKPTPQDMAEGLVQYFPELPLIPTNVITYSNLIEYVSNIHTMSSKLESTSLLFITGIDLFYARTTPSKTFDVLSEDFNYSLLIIIMGALTTAVIVMRSLVIQKKINDSWA